MSGPTPEDWTFEACQWRLREATRIVIDAENKYRLCIEEAADAEALYRKELATAFQTYRTAGKPVEESNTLARGDVVLHSRNRDYAAGVVKLAADKLEDARDSRRSLWRLIEWARERDLIALRTSGTDERVPAERWP